jgi:hypothetical protein
MAEDKSLLRYNPAIKKTSSLILDDEKPDTLNVAWSQDVTDIIKQNQIDEEDHKPRGDLKLAARIPLAVWNHLQEIGIAKDPEALKKWLNDPDNRAHRVWKGRL